MAYTKLNLKDHIDRWDAAKVEHLESGIYNNDASISKSKEDITSLKTLINNTQSRLGSLEIDTTNYFNEVRNLSSKVSNIQSENLLNLFIHMVSGWSAYGNQISKPTFVFDGNIANKITIPVTYESINGCYVKISDETIKSHDTICGTMGGFGDLILKCSALERNNTTLTFDEMAILGLYSCLFGIEELRNFKIGVNGLLASLGIEMPAFFSTEQEFLHEGITYPKGTYVAYFFDTEKFFLPVMSVPAFYVREIWDFEALENIHRENDWSLLKFDSPHTFITKYNEIIWDGVSTLPHPGLLHKVSSNAIQCYNAFKSAGQIIIKCNDNSEHLVSLEYDDLGKCIYIKDDNIVYAIISLSYYNILDGETIDPGMYFTPLGERSIANIKLTNVDTKSIFENKLPINKYHCLGYEEDNVTYGQALHHIFGDNYPTTIINDIQYACISNTPLNTDINDLTIKNYEYSVVEQPAITLTSVDEFCPTLDRESTVPFSWGQLPWSDFENEKWRVPTDVTTDQVVVMRINFNTFCGYVNMSSSWDMDYKDYGTWVWTYLGGPKNNPYPQWNASSNCNFSYSASNVLKGSYLYVAFYPNEAFVRDKPSLWISYDRDGEIVITETLINTDILHYTPTKINENNKEIYYFNNVPYVINDKNEGDPGVYLYSQQTWNEDNTRKYISFVNVVSCEDIINDPIIHKIDKKFLPEGIVLKSETVSVPQTATVGQILSVKAVDENGKPSEWETIDLPKAAAAITDATGDTVSAEQFNTLLASLRAAGYLAIE